MKDRGRNVKGFGIIVSTFFLHFFSYDNHQKLFLSKLFYFLELACLPWPLWFKMLHELCSAFSMLKLAREKLPGIYVASRT